VKVHALEDDGGVDGKMRWLERDGVRYLVITFSSSGFQRSSLHIRLDERAEFLARPELFSARSELFSARPELGSARVELGSSRARPAVEDDRVELKNLDRRGFVACPARLGPAR
jgi:hypothetical protein